MKLYLLLFAFCVSSIIARAQTAPIKWATQETFFEDLVGKNLPDFSSKTIEGKTITTKNLKGKVVLINFWFVACPPCIAEMPYLNLLVEKYKAQNIRFIAITYENKKAIKNFKRKTPYNYEILSLSEAEIRRLNLNHGYPSNILVGTDGKILKAMANISFSEQDTALKAKSILFEETLKLALKK